MDDDKLLRVLKALADPKRLKMVQEIAAAGEVSCGELGEKFALSQPTISHHLKILTDAGLLAVRLDGQHHFISLNRGPVNELLAYLPITLSPPLVHGYDAAPKRDRKRARAR